MKERLYLVVADLDSRMGAKSEYKILTASELQRIPNYGECMEIYKVEKVSKKDRKSLEIGKNYKPKTFRPKIR